MSVGNDQWLVKYIQAEREKDPEFNKLLSPTEDKPLTYEQLLKIVENDFKYLAKVGIMTKPDTYL